MANHSNMACPHCGSSDLVFIASTSVPFEDKRRTLVTSVMS